MAVAARKFIDKNLPAFICIFLFLILPFVYLTFLYDPDSSPRFGLFSVLLALVFSIYYFLGNKISFTADILKNNKALIFYFGWLLFCTTNIFRSYNPGEATYDCLRHGMMFLFLLIVISLFKKDKDVLWLFIAGVAVAVIIFCIYATVQAEPGYMKARRLHRVFEPTYFISSALSNKNFFAETLVLSVPFLLCGIFGYKGWLRIISLLSLVITVAFIVLMESISSWVAVSVFSIAYITFGFILTPKLNRQRRKITLVLFSIVVLSVIAAAFLLGKKAGGLNYKFTTAISYFRNDNSNGSPKNYEYTSSTERLLLWSHTLKMISGHPFLGVGTANWKVMFPAYGSFGLTFMDSGNMRYEHPHNDYLFITAEQGILGLILFLLIYFFVIARAVKRIRNCTDKTLRNQLLFMLCGVISFMALSFFEFPFERFYSLLLLTIIFGFLLSDTSGIKKTEVTASTGKDVLFLPLVILCLFSASVFYHRLTGELHYKTTLHYQQAKQWKQMDAEAQRSRNSYFISDPLATPMNWYSGFACFYGGDIYAAQEYFEKAVAENPFHVQAWNDLGTCFEKQKKYTEAIRCYKRSLQFNNHLSFLNLSAAYFNSGKIDSAYITISSVPDYGGAQYNAFLLAILREKIRTQTGNIDENIKAGFPAQVRNDKLLISVYKNALKEGKDFVAVFADSVSARQARAAVQ